MANLWQTATEVPLRCLFPWAVSESAIILKAQVFHFWALQNNRFLSQLHIPRIFEMQTCHSAAAPSVQESSSLTLHFIAHQLSSAFTAPEEFRAYADGAEGFQGPSDLGSLVTDIPMDSQMVSSFSSILHPC